MAAGWALKVLFIKYSEVQEKRILEAQAASAKLLEFVGQQHEQIELLTRAINANAQATQDMREMFERVVPQPQPGRKTLQTKF